MRKRIGAREFGAAAIIVGIAVLYWMQPASPPVTIADGDAAEAKANGVAP